MGRKHNTGASMTKKQAALDVGIGILLAFVICVVTAIVAGRP
jgi:hypothetical protein